MKEQVLRILKMVEEGRLSPGDALELIDAFMNFETAEADETEAEGREDAPQAEQKAAGKKAEDPFRRLLDSIEQLTKDAVKSVNWTDVAGQVRQAAERGVETLRGSVEQISKGEFKWFGPRETATVELPLKVEAGNTLRLEVTNGDVKVTGGAAEGKLTAKATLRGKSRDDVMEKAKSWTPVIEEHDGSVTLKQSPDAVEEDLEIEVPAGVHLDIRAERGDIRIERTEAGVRLTARAGDVVVDGVKGTVEIESQAGDVKLSRAEGGAIEIENKSGDIWLSDVSGTIQVRSANGDVRGKELAGKTISVETVNGDVDLDLKEPVDGTLNVRTVSGDVLLDLASGSNCRVSLSSLSGSVRSSMPLEDEKVSQERVTGRLGKGEGTLDVSAVSGNISLSLRDQQG
ncbi:MAG: DUF4097 family beta strand repeat protein [Armatimonadetes bacterium]|nr:DUF4097 family beta strand repeat protein [Armatimonadota bacterium]